MVWLVRMKDNMTIFNSLLNFDITINTTHDNSPVCVYFLDCTTVRVKLINLIC